MVLLHRCTDTDRFRIPRLTSRYAGRKSTSSFSKPWRRLTRIEMFSKTSKCSASSTNHPCHDQKHKLFGSYPINSHLTDHSSAPTETKRSRQYAIFRSSDFSLGCAACGEVPGAYDLDVIGQISRANTGASGGLVICGFFQLPYQPLIAGHWTCAMAQRLGTELTARWVRFKNGALMHLALPTLETAR